MGIGKHVALASVKEYPDDAIVGTGSCGQGVDQRVHANIGYLVLITINLVNRGTALQVERGQFVGVAIQLEQGATALNVERRQLIAMGVEKL